MSRKGSLLLEHKLSSTFPQLHPSPLRYVQAIKAAFGYRSPCLAEKQHHTAREFSEERLSSSVPPQLFHSPPSEHPQQCPAVSGHEEYLYDVVEGTSSSEEAQTAPQNTFWQWPVQWQMPISAQQLHPNTESPNSDSDMGNPPELSFCSGLL
ncbi:uncharacterized protein GJ701_011967 [Geothlypis trichas]